MANKKTPVQKFDAQLQSSGKTATGIEVPKQIVAALNAGKRPAVKVTINGYIYRSTIAVYGGVYMVGVSAAVREQAKVKAGDKVEVYVELDTEERTVDIPADFAIALKINPVANEFFNSLSYSNKQGHVLPIEQAKTAETRQRRIQKSIDLLNAKKK